MLSLKSDMESGALVLTVNNRLSRHLCIEYDRWQVTHGNSAWVSPAVFSFETWLKQCRQVLSFKHILLSDWQELLLWEKVIGEDISSLDDIALNFNIESAARLAREAHALALAYRLKLEEEVLLSEENRVFLRWKEQFYSLCTRRNFISPSEFADHVTESIKRGKLQLPAKIILAGFDEFTPQQEHCLDAMARFCEIRKLEMEELLPSVIRLPSEGPESEVRQLIRWIRQLLENKTVTIGVVVPKLAEYVKLLRRISREELTPGAILSARDEPLPLNISMGETLDKESIIRAAIEILSCALGPISVDTIEYILLSPFIGDSEQVKRAFLHTIIKQQGTKTISLYRLASLAEGKGDAPQFARGLRLNMELIRARPEFDFPSAWVEHFATCLSSMGWSGSRSLSSREYQALGAWNELLAALGCLDRVTGKIGRIEALQLLERMSLQRQFQPEGSNAPIQVMGYLESAGFSFDYLWLLGMHEESLPSPARPNPFLPLSLQKAKKLPRSCPERELEFAKKVINRIVKSAPYIVISHPEYVDEIKMRPASLIKSYPQGSVDMSTDHSLLTQISKNRADMEQLIDTRCSIVKNSAGFKGGTSLIKTQAVCPFKAFATYRLGCRIPDDTPEMGLRASERGSLVHKALEGFWKGVGSSKNLKSLDKTSVEDKADKAVRTAITGLIQGMDREIPDNYREMEIGRTVQLMLEFLELEANRPGFTIDALEKKWKVNISGMIIDTRVDRIDRLDDGSILLIDYKTGSASSRDWEGERPQEPQLPIYCLEQAFAVDAVVFAKVRPGECGFSGKAKAGLTLPSQKSKNTLLTYEPNEWDTILKEWQRVLSKLAEAFLQGQAEVDPFNKESCKYCTYTPLCRINELRQR